jgi:diguanylate cyclase (GGDEF)-like protein
MQTDTTFDVIFLRMDRLPTLPGIAIRILEAVQKEEPDLKEIGNIISMDPPLSAEVLKIINSAFYGLPSKVTSVFHAINLLGINTVKNLALSFTLVKNFRVEALEAFDHTLFWKDSLIGAVATKLLAEKILPEYSEDAFFLGLLHNIGILTLLQCMPKQYSLVLKELESTDYAYHEAEDQILGFNHMTVGEYLVKTWGLPETFYKPIGSHHLPGELSTADEEIGKLTKILHLAALYIDFFNLSDTSLTLGLIDEWSNKHGFADQINIDEIGIEIHEQTQSIFPLFEINLKEANDYTQILETSRKEMINISSDLITRILEQKNEIEILRKQVTRDAMTQLHNYQHFYEVLHKEIYRSVRYKSALSLIIADIDNFKAVNDTYGHLAGDRAIKSVADCLKRSLRASDHVARYGGEEFAIILPETPMEGAVVVAERIRKEIESLKINYEDKAIALTLSFGVTSPPFGEQISEEEFVKKADKALYQAKTKGKNRTCSFQYVDDSKVSQPEQSKVTQRR